MPHIPQAGARHEARERGILPPAPVRQWVDTPIPEEAPPDEPDNGRDSWRLAGPRRMFGTFDVPVFPFSEFASITFLLDETRCEL